MTIRTIDTQLIKQNIDLRELAGRYTELHRASGDKELCGPCPKCGGDDRFYCQADFFACRVCHDKRGDAIEFMIWLNGCSFKDAAAMLTNGSWPTPTHALIQRAARRSPEKPPDWQTDIENQAERAHWRLMDERSAPCGDPARAYLLGRGLLPQTWQTFRIGYWPNVKVPIPNEQRFAPAISIPWYKAGKVCAIRYRFLDEHKYIDDTGKEHKIKQTAYKGSEFAGLFFGGLGIGHCIPRLSTLFICEGEINDLSIWQVAHRTHVNVLSLGSESAHITPAMAAYAAQYGRVLAWLDRQERAQAVMQAIAGAYGIKSPDGQDANDMLQGKILGGFLALHRFQAAQNRHEQQRLLYDLLDTPIDDDSTIKVIGHIAQVVNGVADAHQ